MSDPIDSGVLRTSGRTSADPAAGRLSFTHPRKTASPFRSASYDRAHAFVFDPRQSLLPLQSGCRIVEYPDRRRRPHIERTNARKRKLLVILSSVRP